MLSDPLFWVALATALVWTVGALEMELGSRHLGFLREAEPVPAQRAPRVSVIVAARNEARDIRPALGSLLEQRYPALELMVIDDRSTDATGAILDELAAAYPRLRVAHLEELPDGWLGKNHALQRGADAATGEWLLFTDADVTLAPDALSRAVGYAERQRLDHLAIAPVLRMPHGFLDLLAGVFALFFAQFAKPWKARDPRSTRHIGVGAFNLVRAEAYRAAGGHRPIAMRPDDDLKLGKLLKQRGARQTVLFGRGLVSVPWYASVGEMARGLEKNSFAGLDYSVAKALGSSLLLLLLCVWPWVALPLTAGATLALNALSVAVMVLLYVGGTRGSGANPLWALLFPVGALFFVWVILRSTALALARGGIRWRDTFYGLDELRKNRI